MRRQTTFDKTLNRVMSYWWIKEEIIWKIVVHDWKRRRLLLQIDFTMHWGTRSIYRQVTDSRDWHSIHIIEKKTESRRNLQGIAKWQKEVKTRNQEDTTGEMKYITLLMRTAVVMIWYQEPSKKQCDRNKKPINSHQTPPEYFL